MFELKAGDRIIYLKWGTWAMMRFGQLTGTTLTDYMSTLLESSVKLDVLIKMIQAAAEYACISKSEKIDFTEVEICEWIDQCGGVLTPDGQLTAFIQYMADSSIVKAKSPIDEGKKKRSKV